ncbi:RDD family protein [Thiomicrospira cyclica]|uniref:RDD domain containing protein n=1 Tax=Thiomicrospira cyclica (strain DSM 14477 / JCM 11371 / ALM1) TaxID=717773 RepID=F6DBT5_THICA|nr:RDD family protein [Thiomicrospira cyclica]AEG31321.1 RDD domain containing protein [Thiomicrospira cyclica ALM1]
MNNPFERQVKIKEVEVVDVEFFNKFKTAGLFLRAKAFFVDLIIVLLLIFLLLFILERIAFFYEKDIYQGIKLFLFIFLVPYTYFAQLESSKKQATFGKQIFRLKVSDIEGRRISYLRAGGRFLGKILSITIFFIGVFLILFTRKKQGLHDIFSNTIVVSKLPEFNKLDVAVDENQIKYAGFWVRFLARLIDSVIVFPLLIISLIFSSFFSRDIDDFYGKISDIFIIFAVLLLYTSIMNSSNHKATLGKKIFGLQVVDSNNERISYFIAMQRFFSEIISIIFLGAGYFMIAFSQKKQGLHDKISETFVIYSVHKKKINFYKYFFWIFIYLFFVFGSFYLFSKIYNYEHEKSQATYIYSPHTINEPVVTLQNYLDIYDSMTYQDVVSLIGIEGDEISRSSLSSELLTSDHVFYSWVNPDGSNLIAFFIDGRLVSKNQAGLR